MRVDAKREASGLRLGRGQEAAAAGAGKRHCVAGEKDSCGAREHARIIHNAYAQQSTAGRLAVAAVATMCLCLCPF